MNILEIKRQKFVDELAKATIAREYEINEKVNAYRASLEAKEDKHITRLREDIAAVDVLMMNCAEEFEAEELTDDDEADFEEYDIEEAIEDENINTVEESNVNLADCFKKQTVCQRPGMNPISIPTRH